MSKVFRYRDINISIPENEQVILKIEFHSPGNYGRTFIDIPGDNDLTLVNIGQISLGYKNQLIQEATIIVSELINFVTQSENISIKYFINDELIVHYDELKSVTDRPLIIIHVKFI